MDPAKYWIQLAARRKQLLSEQKAPLFPTPRIITAGGSSANRYETWEERAFAEDSAGHLGGCIWPPRSYSCNFCAREFRSAQALGGHMNVHRRDRARLRLSAAPAPDVDGAGSESNGVRPPPHCQTYMIQRPPCPPQISVPQHAYSASPSTAPRAGAADTITNPNSMYAARSLVQVAAARTTTSSGKQVILSAPLASPTSESSTGREHGTTTRDLFPGVDQLPQDHETAATGMMMRSHPELRVGKSETNTSVLVCRSRRDWMNDNYGDDEESAVQVSHKRRRIDLLVNPLVLSSSSCKNQQPDGDHQHHEKVLKLCHSSSVEELDLELRLGGSPKSKIDYFTSTVVSQHDK
ncbi:hypothetical protein ABZP36_013402 [Zizania latifolia]